VIKKLDSLIIRAFIGPFFATFLISLFVLVMQFFWLYIDDIVGKNLDFFTIFRLVGYVAATTVPMALPLSLLLSSIMTYGNLGESFELVAIKSAGIPLLRFMRPLFITSLFISGIAFLFANNIIPVANLKLNALKYDIIVAKPAFDIKEGVFYDKLDGYVIKIGKKEKDDSTIRNVIIYEKEMGLQDNLLTAESGIMRVTADKRFMEFQLHNGWRYEEKGGPYDNNTQYIRMGFSTYKKVFDLSSFKMSKTDDSLFRYDPKMLTVGQLNYSIDSINKNQSTYTKITTKELGDNLLFLKYKDSVWKKPPASFKSFKTSATIIPDSLKSLLINTAAIKLNNAINSVAMTATEYSSAKDFLTRHLIEWHRKFTLSVACIVLFMIGAPLGSIIRKGGLGTPLIFSIIFFVLFYLLNTFGEKFAKQNVVSPFTGMWLSTLVLIPIGIFLTTKAMRDSQLFNKEFYYRSFRTFKKFLIKIKIIKPAVVE
jgi:lipopolysaccharide export system permease protein